MVVGGGRRDLGNLGLVVLTSDRRGHLSWARSDAAHCGLLVRPAGPNVGVPGRCAGCRAGRPRPERWTAIAVVRGLVDGPAEATMLCRLFRGHSGRGSAPFSVEC